MECAFCDNPIKVTAIQDSKMIFGYLICPECSEKRPTDISNTIRCDYHEHKDLFIVFVCGHALEKGSFDIGYRICQNIGQRELVTTIYDGKSLPRKITNIVE